MAVRYCMHIDSGVNKHQYLTDYVTVNKALGRNHNNYTDELVCLHHYNQDGMDLGSNWFKGTHIAWKGIVRK